MKNMNQKKWKKVIIYIIPILALVIANLLNIDDPTEIQNALTGLSTAILGVLGAIGVIANNDKDDDKTSGQ